MCHIKQATFFRFKAHVVFGRPCGAQPNAGVYFCVKLFSGLSEGLPQKSFRVPED